jgi:tape measure domain-containing protein
MATEIDKRVVEMQFNNKDFEKNCQASLTTLEKLKMALNFDGAKGLETMAKAANKIDLSGLSKGAEAVEVKFNAMNVAGMTAISELTKSFMNFGKRLWDMSFGQMKSGGMSRTLKIEQAMFQMKALAKNIDGVGDSQERVNTLIAEMKDAIDKSVTGTAYGYDAAAAVASQLMASGLTDSKTMYNHLRAIAGAAAMTGRSFEDIGNIFTTIASNGKLMTMQLRQFSASGLNLSATLAQQMGKTEEQINAMVAKGEITFDQFSNALYEAFGEAAGEADKTFSGVTSNVKAQLSRIGQLFTDPFVEKVIPFLQKVKSKIKEIREVLVPISEIWSKLFGYWIDKATDTLDKMVMGRLQPIVNGIQNVFLIMAMYIHAIGKAFKSAFPNKSIEELKSAAEYFENFTASLVPSEQTLNGFIELVKGLFVVLRVFYNVGLAVFKSVILPITKMLFKLLGSVIRLGNALKPFVDRLITIVTESNILENVLSIMTATLAIIIDAVAEIIDAFGILLGKLVNSTTFSAIMKSLYSIAKILSTVIVNALTLVFKIIQKIFSYITTENIISAFNKLSIGVKFIFEFIGQTLASLAGFIEAVANSGTIIGNLFKIVKDLFDLIKTFFSGGDTSESVDKLKSSIDAIKESLVKLFKEISAKLKELPAERIVLIAFALAIIMLVNAMTKFLNTSSTFVSKATNFFGIFDSLQSAIKNIAKYSPVFQTFIGFVLVVSAVTSALVTLSEIDATKLRNATIALASITAVMVALAVGMELIFKKVPMDSILKFNALLVNLVGLAGTLLLVSLAMKILSSSVIDINAFADVMLELGSLILVMVGASMLLSVSGSKVTKATVGIIAFAISIDILANTLIKLTEIPVSDYKKYAAALLAVVGITIALSVAVSLLLSNSILGENEKIAKIGKVLFSFIISLLAVMGLIKLLSTFTNDEVINSLKKLGLLLLPIAGFMVLAMGIMKISGNKSILSDLASMLSAINGTIILLITATAILGSMNASTLVKGLFFVNAISRIINKLVFGLFYSMFGTKGIDYKLIVGEMKQLTKLLLAIGGVVTLLAAASILANKASFEGVARIGILVALVSWISTQLVEVSSNTKEAKIGPIIALISMIATLASSIAILSFGDPWGLMSAGIAIAACIMAVTLLVKYSGELNKESKKVEKEKEGIDKNVIGLIASISLLIMSMAPLVNAVSSFNTNNLNALKAVIGAMIFIMAAILGSIAVIGYIENGKNFRKNVYVITQLISSFAIILASFSILTGVMGLIGGMSIFYLATEVLAISYFINNTIQIMIQAFRDLTGALPPNTSDEFLKKYVKLFTVIIASFSLITLGMIPLLFAMGKVGPLSAAYISAYLLSIAEVVKSMSHMITEFKNIMSEATYSANDKLLDYTAHFIFSIGAGISVILLSITALMTSINLTSPNLMSKIASGIYLAEIFGIIFGIVAITSKFLPKILNSINDIVSKNHDILELTGDFFVSISLALVAMLSGISIMISTMGMIGPWSIAYLILSFGSITGLIIAISFSITEILKNIKDIDDSKIKAIGNTFVKIGAFIAIIFGSLALTSILVHNFSSFGSMMGVVLAVVTLFTITFAELVASVIGMAALSKKFGLSYDKSLSSVKEMLFSVSAILVVISGVLALLAYLDIGSTSKFNTKVDALSSLFKSLTAFIAIIVLALYSIDLASNILTGHSLNLDGLSKLLYSLSATMVIMSTSFIAIAGALSIMTSTVGKHKQSDVDKAKNLLLSVVGLCYVMSLVTGALSMLPGAGDAAKVVAIFGAVILSLSLSALLFAEAISKIVESVKEFNSIQLDASQFKNNLIEVATALRESAKILMPIFVEIMLGVVAVIGMVAIAIANKNAIAVLMFVISIMYGLKAILPDILIVFGEIMREIVDWLYAEQNMKLVEEFAYAIGDLISTVILGCIRGMFKEIDKAVEEYLNKYDKNRTNQMKENQRAYELALAADKDAQRKLKTYEKMGYENIYYDEKKLKEYMNLRQRIMVWGSVSPFNQERLDELYNELFDESGHLIIHGLEEAKKNTDKIVYGINGEIQTIPATLSKTVYDGTKIYTRALQGTEWVDYIKDINHSMADEMNAGIEVNKEYWYSYARSIGMPEEYLKYLGPEFNMKHLEILDDIQNGSNEIVGSIVSNNERLEKAAQKTAESAQSGVVKTTARTREQVESDTEKVVEDTASLTSKIADAIGSAAQSMGLDDVSALGDFGNDLKDVAGMMGKTAGNKLGEDFVNEVDWWIKYGNEKIILNQTAFDQSKGKTGFQYRWEKEGAESLQSYAEDQKEAYDKMISVKKMLSGDTEEVKKRAFEYLGIEESTDSIKEQTSALTENMNAFENYGDIMESTSDSVDDAKAKFDEFTGSIKDSVTSAIKGLWQDVKESEIMNPEDILYNMQENARRIGEWTQNISRLAAMGLSEGLLNELKDLGPEGMDTVKSFTMMTQSQIAEANRRYSAAAKLPDYATNKIVDSYKEAGYNASLGFAKGVSTKESQEAMINLADTSLDSLNDELEIHSPSRKTMESGEYLALGLAQGMTSIVSMTRIGKAGAELARKVIESVNNNLNPDKLKTYGSNAITGIVNGFKNVFPTAYSIISRMIDSIANIIPSKWEIHSPSRLFAEFGEFAIGGLAKGFITGGDAASSEMDRTADDILNSMRDAIYNSVSNAESLDEYVPTIRPVFDLTALDQGYNDIQSWLDANNGFNIGTNIRNLTPTSKDDPRTEQRIAEAIENLNNDDVVTELVNLRTDISNLQESMTHLRVVMNSKALVGQIIPDVDSALGNRIVKNTRGRY